MRLTTPETSVILQIEQRAVDQENAPEVLENFCSGACHAAGRQKPLADTKGKERGVMMMPTIFRDNLMDDFAEDFPFWDDKDMKKMERKIYGRRGKNLMRTDIREMKKGYRLVMDLPGFSKDEVKLSLEDGYLTVEAAKGRSRDKEEKGRYIRQERYAGACRRSFYVGNGVSEEDVKASFRHGVLKLWIPKKETIPEKERSYIRIEG